MNTPAKIETPYGRECRQRDRIQAVRDRYYREWQRMVAEMEAEVAEIMRRAI